MEKKRVTVRSIRTVLLEALQVHRVLRTNPATGQYAAGLGFRVQGWRAINPESPRILTFLCVLQKVKAGTQRNSCVQCGPTCPDSDSRNTRPVNPEYSRRNAECSKKTDMNLQSVPGHDFDTVSRKHVYEKNVFVGQVFPESTLLHGSWAMVCSTVVPGPNGL